MLRVLGVLLVLGLVACGGGDDDDDGPGADPGSTMVATSGRATVATGRATAAGSAATEPAAGAEDTEVPDATAPAVSSGGNPAVPAGAPTPEDPDFPDVYAPLAPGSSVEVDTGEDPFSGKPSRARYTIDAIADPAEPVTTIYVPQSGNRWVAFEITVDSLGEGGISQPEWVLQTTDGQAYDWIGGTGLGESILFMALPRGESTTGMVVFEIPEAAEVAWLLIDPAIYVGRNIVFVAE